MQCIDQVDACKWTAEWFGEVIWNSQVAILVRPGRGTLESSGTWGDRLIWGHWKGCQGEDLWIGSVYAPADSMERKLWLREWIDSDPLEEVHLDILEGDFNMVYCKQVDRSDGGVHSPVTPGLTEWKVLEQSLGMQDSVRLFRGEQQGAYMHWSLGRGNGVGTHIDWILVEKM